MKKDKIPKLIALCVCFFALSLVGFYIAVHKDVDSIAITTVDYRTQDEIIVEVKGEVKSPGKYSVARGTPIHDVLYMAGGITKEGNIQTVRVDTLLTEPCTIEVGEKSGADIDAHILHTYDKNGGCNINTATHSQLCKLPAIGDKIATDIINYRKVNGGFKSTQEIKNVEGIGEKTYSKIKDLINVGGENG